MQPTPDITDPAGLLAAAAIRERDAEISRLRDRLAECHDLLREVQQVLQPEEDGPMLADIGTILGGTGLKAKNLVDRYGLTGARRMVSMFRVDTMTDGNVMDHFLITLETVRRERLTLGSDLKVVYEVLKEMP